MMSRKIIHVDMDCFYAAIEVRDNPSLTGLPVAVGGASDRRGVISTCNYQARTFGVHSAMATSFAQRLCPQLKVIPGRMQHYQMVSKQIRQIFDRYTDIIEPLSLDEAYLDVSSSNLFDGSATLIAKDIRRAIKNETGLTASAGIAPNKFLAKVCSDENKPDGQCVVSPERVEQFVQLLPLKKIPGVGKVTLERLAKYGLCTCADVRSMPKTELIRLFGNLGDMLYQRARGIDQRLLTTSRVRKSLSVERTFSVDLNNTISTLPALESLYTELSRRLEKHPERQICNQQIKLKFSDFKVTTVERQSNKLNRLLFDTLLPIAWSRSPDQGIRLLGLGVTFKPSITTSDIQLPLF
ncbi:MAG: DNA polymerase IV [Pseudomonadales bacterium]|nr:DNA polymerase IV [Pseudomonadales bacterium]